ncbi:rho GTPase-activating protein 29-like isoform X2 [Salvelinus fontinalis]|uniref:rho GTPase-activating protein 29-like isoform X2 n=1 Tax=Salvelinus fontinalis TaxID=8038 RepID=UPI002484E684|nr:rho GTPase-activating protein 29-like isoform X2 [Salvelinus fontinalis]
MIRKSSSGTGGGGGGEEGNNTKHQPNKQLRSSFTTQGPCRLSNMGRSYRTTNPLGSMELGSNSLGLGSTVVGAPGVDPDYVLQLVNDVRRFSDMLLSLKEAFHSEESHEGLPQRVQERLVSSLPESHEGLPQQVQERLVSSLPESQEGLPQRVQERLRELLRVLKSVIGKHQTLNSVDILRAAGTVIAKVKGVNFKEVNQENNTAIFGEIYTSIDSLAFTFGNVVSDFLMGDVDSQSGLGIPQTTRSRSFENLSVDSEGYVPEKKGLVGPEVALSKEEEVDVILQKNDSGVESVLLYAKAWSKYTKDLLAWVDKRLGLDVECAKSYVKMAESAKTLASQQDYMPFRNIYISTFKNDVEYSQLLLQTATALQTNKFIQPLLSRKTELDKLRKDIKEQWQREQKKMQESEVALRKARWTQAQKRDEYYKAQSSASRSQEEQSKQLDKKRRMEEEALQKAEDARDQYRACVTDAGARRAELASTKTDILTQIRELVTQCDLTLKAVTVNWLQLQQAQTVSLPVHYQALCENAKMYEPGQRYAEFVRNLSKDQIHMESSSIDERFPVFNKRSTGSTSSHSNLSQVSVISGDVLSGDEVDSPLGSRPGKRSNSATDIQGLRGGPGPLRAWASGIQDRGMCSDSESAGGSSESQSMDSPTASPGDFKRRLPRTPSTGTMSSADDLDERQPPSPSDNGLGEMVTETASSPGPFRNAQMSKASQTHKLRKLRAPSKCRECDSLVVFHGAECEECSLACHKKCLETLAIQCGHKKLQGRLHLFGIDFTQAAKNSPDGIPFIIRKCTSEIEIRALNLKGIYRVNGAKSRVEKLCQAFENGKDLVELSDLSPHDIANVLKLYLRQLPEPLILYRYYNDFIGLAKESQRVIIEEKAAARALQDQGRPGGEQPRPGDTQPGVEGEQPPLTTSQPGGGELPKQPSIKLNRVIFKIRDLLRQLPPAHYRTLRFLTAHLHRVTEQAEENKMTASNLGIIFGPTLVKPRQTDAEVSLSSLVDYPYQALMVELLVRHFQVIFDLSSPPSSYPPTTTTTTVGQTSSSSSYPPTTTATVGQTSSSSYPPTTNSTVGQTSSSYPPTTTSTVGQTSSSYPPTTNSTVGQTSSSYPPTTTATVGQTSSSYPPTTTATVGQTSPRLTPQEKEQRLSLQSTSLLDIKENAKVYKRHSSVIQSSQTLDDVREVKTDRRELTAGSSSSAAGSASVQRSTLVFGRPSLNLSSFTSSSTAPKVQLRPQRARILSRPISMPLERLPLPTPSQVVDRNSRNNHAAAMLDSADNTIVESAEPEKQKETEKPRIGEGSRVSTYYIDTQQAVQRRPWDRKYKHYDVTPRTAMIMANLPPAGTSPGPKPGKQPTMPTQLSVSGPTSSALPSSSSFSTIFPDYPYTVSLKAGQMSRRDREETKDRPNAAAEGGGETRTSTNSPIKFRQPRILQPPPGTFYKPSGYSGTRGWPSLSTSGTTSLTKMSPTSSTVKTSSPTVKTSSPTSSTVKTFSPTVKTSSPTSSTVKTSSPTSSTVKTSSPTSPTVKTSSPTVKTSSPTYSTVKTSSPTSPTVKTSSSTVKTSSPTSSTVKTSSPTSSTVRTSSPTSSTVKTSSPTSPTVKTSSPTSPTVKTSSPTSSTVKTSSPTSSTVKTSSLTSSTVKTSSPTPPTVKTFPTSPTVTAPLLLSSSHSSSITFSSSPMVTTTSPSPITTYTLQTSNLPTHTLQDSVDSSVSVDPEVTTSADLSPRQSPPPSSPEDPSLASEVLPLQQRLRPRPGARLQELEHREAHFV